MDAHERNYTTRGFSQSMAHHVVINKKNMTKKIRFPFDADVPL